MVKHPPSPKGVIEGALGASQMVLAFLTPMLRHERSHWGATPEDMRGPWPGDELVPSPRWMWHHAIVIEAPASAVWPWIAQIGIDRGGFYSHEFLENLAGCELHNAERIHPEWELAVGDPVRLHPKMPALRVRWAERDRGIVIADRKDLATDEEVPDDVRLPARHVAVSWAFLIDPLSAGRCRFVSRFRASYPDDLALRTSLGPTFTEPVGFVMDRKMLETVKELVEREGTPER